MESCFIRRSKRRRWGGSEFSVGAVANFPINAYPPCIQGEVLLRFIQSDRDFEVRLIDVQHQSGSSDCILFAVAFAQVLCAGLDPHLTTFDQKSMREHLFSSFEDGELLPFPLAQRQRRLGRRRVVRKQKVPVYCSCRLPWNKKDNVRGPLVSCHICNEWFHQDCENIPDIVFDQADYVWLCHMCS